MHEPTNELERTQRGALATALEALRAVARQTNIHPSPWAGGFLQGADHALDAVAAAMKGIGPEEFQNTRGAALIADGWKLGPFNAKTKTSPAACDSDSLSPEMRIETRAIFSVTSGYTFLAMAAIKDRDRGLEVFDHVASSRGYDPHTAIILGVSYHFENSPTMCCEAPSPKFVPMSVEAQNLLSQRDEDAQRDIHEATQENVWRDTAAQFSRDRDYYRGLVVRIGEAIGDEAYIADDGTRMEDVLCEKVPDLAIHAIEMLKMRRAQGGYIGAKTSRADALHDAQPDPTVVQSDLLRAPVAGDVLYDADHVAEADGSPRRVRCGRVFFTDGDLVSAGFTDRDLGIYSAKDLVREPVSVVWRIDRPAKADPVPEMGHTIAFEQEPNHVGYIESARGDVVCVFPGGDSAYVSPLRIRPSGKPGHWIIAAPVCDPPSAPDPETAPSRPAEAPSVSVDAPVDPSAVETIPAPADAPSQGE